ncbi:MAG: DNA methyltransferase [Pseudomonadota bacterium]
MGITPYYQQKGIVIYNCDCREILPDLPPVDLILTDPPYGINYQSARRIAWQRKDKIQGDKNFPLWIFDVMKPRNALFVWLRWDVLPLVPLPKSFIVWDKMNHSMGDLKHEIGRQWEGCAFYPGPEHKFIKRPADIIRCKKIPAEKLLHPNEKPVGAMLPLIKAHSSNLILDPFMGVAPVLLAAKLLGRRAIGIEIEEKYCEIAARRLSQEVLPFGRPFISQKGASGEQQKAEFSTRGDKCIPRVG